MKRDKELEKYADEQLSLLRDDAFLESLKSKRKQNAKNQKMHKKSIIVLSAAVCAATMVIVLLCVFLINPSANNGTHEQGDSKYYAQENQKTVSSSVEEVNDAVEHITINNLNGIMISKVVDAYYNETLYYVIIYNDDSTMESITIFVVVNDDYTLPFPIVGTRINETVADYSVSYTERYTEDDNLFYVDTEGEIFTEKERVYVEYSGVDFERKNNFLAYLSNVIS